MTLNGTDQNPVSSLIEISNQHTASIDWEGNLKTIFSDIHSFIDKEFLTLEDLEFTVKIFKIVKCFSSNIFV